MLIEVTLEAGQVELLIEVTLEAGLVDLLIKVTLEAGQMEIVMLFCVMHYTQLQLVKSRNSRDCTIVLVPVQRMTNRCPSLENDKQMEQCACIECKTNCMTS